MKKLSLIFWVCITSISCHKENNTQPKRYTDKEMSGKYLWLSLERDVDLDGTFTDLFLGCSECNLYDTLNLIPGGSSTIIETGTICNDTFCSKAEMFSKASWFVSYMPVTNTLFLNESGTQDQWTFLSFQDSVLYMEKNHEYRVMFKKLQLLK